MIHHIWFIMMTVSIACCFLNGRAGVALEAALAGSGKALSLTADLCGGYMLFCGLMEIAKGLHVEKSLGTLLAPLMKKVMPDTQSDESRGAVALNLSMNLLGMGNAATPAGLEAMRRMEAEKDLRPGIRHDMEMLLILNATSLQLLPTTVLTLRTAAGSAEPNAVLIPTILCTLLSTITGVIGGLLCRRWEERRHAG